MTEHEAIAKLQEIIRNTAGKEIKLSVTDDLRDNSELDSLDLVMFLIEFENQSGLKLPEADQLGKEGWHKVSRLAKALMSAS